MSIIFIKYSLLNFFFIKQVILHLKYSVSSTVTKFEHCTSDAAIPHNIAKFLYQQFQLLMNNPNLARQWPGNNIEYEINTQPLPSKE
jgi:hypothetical protein